MENKQVQGKVMPYKAVSTTSLHQGLGLDIRSTQSSAVMAQSSMISELECDRCLVAVFRL